MVYGIHPKTNPTVLTLAHAGYDEVQQPIAYLKRLRGDLQNDIAAWTPPLCQALVRLSKLKRASGHNAVITDRSGQGDGQEVGGRAMTTDDAIYHEFTLSRSTVDQPGARVGWQICAISAKPRGFPLRASCTIYSGFRCAFGST